jgi:hypothetical protein
MRMYGHLLTPWDVADAPVCIMDNYWILDIIFMSYGVVING